MKLSAKWTVLTRQKHLNVTGMEVSTISQRIYSLLVREELGTYESEASSDESEGPHSGIGKLSLIDRFSLGPNGGDSKRECDGSRGGRDSS